MGDTFVGTIVLQSILFAVGLFKIYTDMQIKMKELDVRLTAVERRDEEIYHKLERIMDKLSELNVKLEGKQSKPQ